MQYNRYGTDTRPRILGAVNHIDKVIWLTLPVDADSELKRSPSLTQPPFCLQLYRPLGIRVMLVGLEMWTYRDSFVVDSNSETTLDRFLLWRQNDLLKRSQHDTAQLVTWADQAPHPRKMLNPETWSCFLFPSTAAKISTETRWAWPISMPCVRRAQAESTRWWSLTGMKGWMISLFLVTHTSCIAPPGSPCQRHRPGLHHRPRDGTQLWLVPR